jgi:hypothetical protein
MDKTTAEGDYGILFAIIRDRQMYLGIMLKVKSVDI